MQRSKKQPLKSRARQAKSAAKRGLAKLKLKTGGVGPGRPQNEILMIDKEWFAQQMRAAGMKSFAALARSIGIDKTVVSRSINGERPFTAADIVAIAGAFGVPVAEVMRRVGHAVPEKPIPIVGKVLHDGRVSSVTVHKNESFFLPDAPADAQALVGEMSGDVLSSYNGATFLFIPAKRGKTSLDIFGQLCVLEVEGNLTPFLGTLVRGTGRGKIAIEVFGSKEKIEASADQIHSAAPILSIHFP